ncbi:MAG: alpha/beta fold hydrolase [Paracoccaceae bacterium]
MAPEFALADCKQAPEIGQGQLPDLGRKPFHLVAHSLGAVPALALAGVVDFASLTLIAPMGLVASGNVDFLTAMAAPDSARAVKRLPATLTEIATGLSDTAIDAIYAEQARGCLVALAAHLGDRQASILPVLAKVAREMRVRLLIGDKDRIVGMADLGKLSSEITMHKFADTGHMPHWENPGAVVNILLAARCHRWQP